MISDIIFVTENGSCITEQDKIIFMKTMYPQHVKKIIEQLNSSEMKKYIISGKNHAYIDRSNDQ